MQLTMRIFSQLRQVSNFAPNTITVGLALMFEIVEHRVWSTIHFISFYGSTTFSVQNYNLGATLLSIGLLYWHSLLAAAIGSFILTLVLVLNSRGPLRYHVGFPAFLRTSAGLSGSKFFICVRALVACLYFAVQTYYAGKLRNIKLSVFGS